MKTKVLYFALLLSAVITTGCRHRSFTLSGHIVDPVRDTIYDGTIVVRNGIITDIRPDSVTADAPYIMPGFYDAHMHIESTLMLPENFARLAVAQGTIGCINDPHEIANVLDMDGIRYMLQSCHKVRFHFHTGAPSCVPSTTFETAGGDIDADELNQLLSLDDIYGCGEVMNVPGVVMFHDSVLLQKITYTLAAGKIVDGHAPGIDTATALAYYSAGVSTNHECTTLSEGRYQHDLGVLIAIREGSAARDFDALSPLLAEYEQGLAFCTDDIYPDELREGYINRLCARAVKKGYPLWNILHAACVAPVRHYHLTHGLLQIGDAADFICVNNLTDFQVLSTYIDGYRVFANGQVTPDISLDDTPVPTPYPNHFVADSLTVADIRVTPQAELIKVIDSQEGSLLTGTLWAQPVVADNNVISDVQHDVLKLVCYSRHSHTQPVVAFIKGFGLKRGAIASTIAHDSHNIIALGTNDADIVAAINRLVTTQGGLAACCGDVMYDMPLPVAGLMSPLPGDEVANQYTAIRTYVRQELGGAYQAPFMTLAFMALPVIPELKITDLGLFDANQFQFTSIWP